MATRKFLRIRDRNQVTLPADLMEALSLNPGDFLQLNWSGSGTMVLKTTKLVAAPSAAASREVKRALAGPAKVMDDQQLKQALQRRSPFARAAGNKSMMNAMAAAAERRRVREQRKAVQKKAQKTLQEKLRGRYSGDILRNEFEK